MAAGPGLGAAAGGLRLWVDDRPAYRKKRFVIPAVSVALVTACTAAVSSIQPGDAPAQPLPAATAANDPAAPADDDAARAKADQQAHEEAQRAAEERAAAELEAAEDAAAKAEAERAAAERAAAEEAARIDAERASAEAAAEQAAAAQAAAEQAARREAELRAAQEATETRVAGATYANCSEVRAAGAAPIYPGDPGWEPKFDRDKDGVGCEN